MTLQEFLRAIEEEFPEIEAGVLHSEQAYREILKWNSLNALILVSKIQQLSKKNPDMDDILTCNTFRELFQTYIDHVE